MFIEKDLIGLPTKGKNKFYKIDGLDSFVIGAWNVEDNNKIFKLTLAFSDPKKPYFGGNAKRITQNFTLIRTQSRKEKNRLIVDKFNIFLDVNKYSILKLILG